MSIGQIIVLAAIVGAFVLFAAVLAWEDYRAQQLVHRIRDRDRKGAALTASAMASKKDDKSAAADQGLPKPAGRSRPTTDCSTWRDHYSLRRDSRWPPLPLSTLR
jgi:hypothetical protein